MKAELNTKCGCKREIKVTWPPPPTIGVPLNCGEWNRAWLKVQPFDPTDPLQTRMFKLTDTCQPKRPQDTAYHAEV